MNSIHDVMGGEGAPAKYSQACVLLLNSHTMACLRIGEESFINLLYFNCVLVHVVSPTSELSSPFPFLTFYAIASFQHCKIVDQS